MNADVANACQKHSPEFDQQLLHELHTASNRLSSGFVK
jgi:hypothetical protein